MSDYAKYVGGETENPRPSETIKKGYVQGAVLSATMGSFFFGYVMSAFNPISNYILKEAFGEEIPKMIHNLMTSFVPLGAGVGALSAGKFASAIGRRKLMYVLDFISIVGTILTILPSPYLLLVGRLLQGFCVGANSSLVPLYINEIAPAEIGGTLGTWNQLLITIGVLIPPLLANIGNANSGFYKVILAPAAVTPIIRILLNTSVYTLETPKYLVSIGQYDEAQKAFSRIYEERRAEEELSALRNQQELESQSGKLTMKDIFSPKYKMRLFLGVMVAIFQQLSGINAIVFFSNNIFGEEHGNLYTLIMDVLQIVGTVVAGLIIERLGRKSLLVNGMGATAIVLGLFGIISFINSTSPVLPFMIWGYIVIFGLSLGPIPWIYIADVLPDIAIGIAVLGNWASTFVISLVFPIIADPDALGMGGGILVFAIASALGCVFMAIFIKETKGKTEAEISSMFSLKSSSMEATFS